MAVVGAWEKASQEVPGPETMEGTVPARPISSAAAELAREEMAETQPVRWEAPVGLAKRPQSRVPPFCLVVVVAGEFMVQTRELSAPTPLVPAVRAVAEREEQLRIVRRVN